MDDLTKHLVGQIDKVATRHDELVARLGNIDETLARQNVVLDEHMRRSLANEKLVAAVYEDLAPIKLHVAVAGALAKGIGLAGTLVGIAAGVGKMVGWF